MYHKPTLPSWRIIRRYTHLSVTALNYFIRHFNLLSIHINLKIAEHGDIVLKFLQYFRLRMVSNINHKADVSTYINKRSMTGAPLRSGICRQGMKSSYIELKQCEWKLQEKMMPPSLKLIHRKLKLLFIIKYTFFYMFERRMCNFPICDATLSIGMLITTNFLLQYAKWTDFHLSPRVSATCTTVCI